jgi:subtilisin family serine protease
MFGIRRTLSSGALVGIAALALAVVASAPAASGQRSGPLAFLTGAHARGQPPATVERLQQPSGLRRGSWPANQRSTTGGRVRMVVETSNVALARASVLRAGGRIERTAPGLVQVLIAPSAERALVHRPGIDLVREPYTHTEQAVGGEEVAASLGSAWHAKGFTGKGAKVAIIDGGFAGLSLRQSYGDLPTSVVTQDFCHGELESASDHGAAVAEIVHEMAPDAQLYLICIDTDVDLAAAVAYAKSQGVDVINHSMGWEGPFRDDGRDPISALVADARASGILWVNAAGNEADTHWTGTYAGNNGLLQWGPNGDIGNTFIWPNGSEICGFLKWDEWPAGVSDFDLYLVLSGANVLLASSEEEQGEGGGETPFEAVCEYQDSGADLRVFWAIGGYSVRSSPRLDLVSWSPSLQYSVPAGSIGTPATSPAALAVGALCWQSRQLEFYSSQGPTIDGRMKPELVGHDSVSGGTYGAFDGSCPSAFAGTSASSPEVAGAAALVAQAYPKWSPDQIQQYLTQSARDLGASGPDSVYGAGELLLPAPPDLVAPTAKALVSTGRRGQMLKLLAFVSDDSGRVSVIEQVKLGGHTVATIKRAGITSVASPKTLTTLWKVPSHATGAYQHCIRVADQAGNASALSCAKLVLK